MEYAHRTQVQIAAKTGEANRGGMPGMSTDTSQATFADSHRVASIRLAIALADTSASLLFMAASTPQVRRACLFLYPACTAALYEK